MSETLGEALPKEIERVQGIIALYKSCPGGIFAATLMEQDVKRAHKAMMEGDLPEMIAVYQELKEWEDG